ncbi:unnamed protein product [Trichogramma brassicae]|uniref:Uncharacterized protein n=1 Tax=Trichogramma brassicae TaxID=86971 RepID=A0A6H5I4P2_9HYME|nr:unnamed protein product [Trichogramma brassicae]
MKEHRKHQRDRQLRIPASTHEPVGPLINKTALPDAGSDAQAEFRSGTDAAVAPPTVRPLALPFPYSFETYSHIEMSSLGRLIDSNRLAVWLAHRPDDLHESAVPSGIDKLQRKGDRKSWSYSYSADQQRTLVCSSVTSRLYQPGRRINPMRLLLIGHINQCCDIGDLWHRIFWNSASSTVDHRQLTEYRSMADRHE